MARLLCGVAWACLGMVALVGEAREHAGWHDDNIVLVDGHWAKVPDSTWGSPHPPYDDRWKSNSSTIIVLIAALRESRLPATIINAFDQAAVPDRIRIGVVQQNDESDPDCIEEVCKLRGRPLVRVEGTRHVNVEFTNPNNCYEFDRVRVVRLDKSEAKGPVYARGLQPKTLQDEDFCMQIDAHSIFKKSWDLLMLQQWGMTENEFAVLSTYPTNYKDLDKNSNNHWEMPHLCGVSMSSSGALSNHQASACANLKRPLIAPLWAAGLSFSRCHAERDVPNDLNLKQVFSGEEFSRGARLWTHGYDFYSITRPVIGVYYGGDKGNKGSWHHDRRESKASQERLMTLLRLPNSDQSPKAIAALGKFGLGSSRTLEQYIEFTGVDTIRGRAVKEKCIVKYVPWDDTGRREMIVQQERRLKRLSGKASLDTISVKSLGGDIPNSVFVEQVDVDDDISGGAAGVGISASNVSGGHQVTWLIFVFAALIGLKKFGQLSSKGSKSR